MRTLKFIVDDQSIRPDPSCNFTGLFPGLETEVRAEFRFSDKWKNSVKVAAFYSMMGAEYPPQELKDGESCMIPNEALKRAAFKVQILAKRNNNIIRTDKLTIYQKGGHA